jgi:hypothetical protein
MYHGIHICVVTIVQNKIYIVTRKEYTILRRYYFP